jgi:outer membrane lipoprotein-sorting protein
MNDLHHPCELWAERISLAAAGCLSSDEEREVDRHIQTCSACRERFGQLTQLCGALVDAQSPADDAAAAIVARIISAVAAGEPRPGPLSLWERVRVRAARVESIHPVLFTRSLTTWRWIMRSPVSRVAAAMVFILAITGIVLWFHGGGATYAFADFIRPLLEAKTARFKTVSEMKGQPTVRGNTVAEYAPNRYRMESKAKGSLRSVAIVDADKRKMLVLWPDQKRGMLATFPGKPKQAGSENELAYLQSLLLATRDKPGLKREPLGEKVIDGHRVVGYRLSSLDRGQWPTDTVMTLWGDPKTGLPVRVEIQSSKMGSKVTISDFAFDVELDKSLFSLTPPAGYTISDMSEQLAASLSTPGAVSATFAFADFIKPILEAKTVKFKSTVVVKGPQAMTATSEEMVLDAKRSRSETNLPGNKMIHITDWGRGKTLWLYPATKQATIQTFANMPKNVRNDPSTWPTLLRMAQENKTKGLQFTPLGEKRIDGRRVVGFRINSDRGLTDLWGDPKTGMPVRVETTMGIDGNTKVTFSDFVFNVDMDESLFSVDPPPGYTVQNDKSDFSPQTEKDLVAMFREYAKLIGAFPDALDSRKVSEKYWRKYNIQEMWERISHGKGSEQQRRRFEEQVSQIMDRITAKVMAGKPYDEETRQMSELTRPMVTEALWDELAPDSWRNNAERKREFEASMVGPLMANKPNQAQQQKMSERMMKFTVAMIWENCAPEKVRTNQELKHRFENVMLKSANAKLSAEQQRKLDDEVGKIAGPDMVKAMKTWETKRQKTASANPRKTAEAQKAKSDRFMAAQHQIGRGLTFAEELPPSCHPHYAGKGVTPGAAGRPIFWYRPKDAKKYRVIYADLSVREADTPPSVPNAQPLPKDASPKM